MNPFAYPAAAHVRRHGPRGYADYKHYKPWLRDEFTSRCVYCLCRETWLPDGQAYFAVDHLLPRSQAAAEVADYDSLVYACCMCNACKKDFPNLIAPDMLILAKHVAVQADCSIAALTLQGQTLTLQGQTLIDVCALNRPELVAFRRDLILLFKLLEKRRGDEATRLRKRYFGFPADLPDLALLRPPEGNSRPDGIAASFTAWKRRGEQPDFY